MFKMDENAFIIGGQREVVTSCKTKTKTLVLDPCSKPCRSTSLFARERKSHLRLQALVVVRGPDIVVLVCDLIQEKGEDTYETAVQVEPEAQTVAGEKEQWSK